MPLVKIHLLDHWTYDRKNTLNELVHSALLESLGVPQDDYFHRLFTFSDQDFVFPSSKSRDFMIIEIHIFPGRSESQKTLIYSEITKRLQSGLGINPRDVFIQLIEQPNINWGFNGQPRNEN